MSTLAAVDCGTNSTRLLVSEHGDRTLERLQRITRLGAGVDSTGRLAPEAIERTLDVLREYQGVMERHGVESVRMTATSAARDAGNREDFFEPAAAIVGTKPELLDGQEEGRLSFLGATHELPGDELTTVVDIGGGSTEIALGHAECEGVISVDTGCVRVTEQFFHHDPPLPEELSAAISVIDLHLDDVERALPQVADATRFVGLAGTITTVAAVEMGLPEYDRDRIHHFELTRAAAEDVFRTLATEPHDARIHNPGLEEARADVIVGGCCVLVAVMRRFGFDRCLVSEADILDGLVRSLVEERR